MSKNCSCETVQRVTDIRYIISFHETLKNDEHLYALLTKTRKVIRVMAALRHSVNPTSPKQVYFTICQSIITYFVGIWGLAAKSHIVVLRRAQRAVSKVIYKNA